MTKELVQIKLRKIMQTRAYTVVVIGDETKSFPIYADPSLGQLLQINLTGSEKPRPLTHDLVSTIFKGMKVRVKQIVINDLEETVYKARLFLEQQIHGRRHIIEIDARPSDCITLALLNNVPLYCTREVMDRAIPVED